MTEQNLKKTNSIAKKFLDSSDPRTATCPKCGKVFSPTAEQETERLGKNWRFCNACGAELILPSEKIDAKVEMIMSEINQRKEASLSRTERQQAAIEKAARDNKIDFKSPDGKDEAFKIALSESPELFRKSGVKR